PSSSHGQEIQNIPFQWHAPPLESLTPSPNPRHRQSSVACGISEATVIDTLILARVHRLSTGSSKGKGIEKKGKRKGGRGEIKLTPCPPSVFFSSSISYTMSGSSTSLGAVMMPNSTMPSKFL